MNDPEFQGAWEKEQENEPTTPLGIPTLRWLIDKAHKGEITAEEFVKLSKARGDFLRETPLGSIPGLVGNDQT